MFDFFSTKQPAPNAGTDPSTASTLLAEGERLVREAAGDLTALGSLIVRLPAAVRDAVVEASHRMLGAEATGQAITIATTPAPTEGKVDGKAAPPDALHQVMQHAGERLADDGGFSYVVGEDGAFEVVGAPDDGQKAIGRRLAPHGPYATSWQALAAKLGVTSAAPTAAPAATAAPTAQAAGPISTGAPMAGDAAAGVAGVKTREATLAGDTLDIAKTRVDLGAANTHYNRTFTSKAEEKQYAVDLASGATTQDTFYCSGLSIWTLAAAGYEMSTRMKGSDGVDIYGETTREVDVDAAGKEVKKKSQVAVGKGTVVDKHYVTFKELIDGAPRAVEIMTLAQQKLGGKGGSVGPITGAGYAVEHEGDELPLAARGAAAAFTFAHVGAEVPAGEQKPGDFAQSRRRTKGADDKGTEEQRGHYGAGHAWQVWSCDVKGAALFGQPGSPKPVTGELSGWHEDVEYVIAHDTDPATVGAHTMLKAQKLEANWGKSMEDKETDGGGARDAKGNFLAGDGGVQITGAQSTKGEAAATDDGNGVFYGRLASSPWATWTPARRPA